MDLSIIIVSWNVKELLKKCLASIYQSQGSFSFEVFVVDNASADGTAAMVSREFSMVKLIANQKNAGFSRANNQAIKEASGEYILLLNPDTEVFPDTLERSLAFMRSRERCGIMGCRILNPDNTLQPSVRRFPTFLPIFLMLLKLPKIFPRLKAINSYLARDFDYEQTKEVDQLEGAFMILRREVFNKIGLLDEKFFTWFEEVDLCRRAKNSGYGIYYFSEARIIHHGGQSFAQEGTLKKQIIFFTSAFRYLFKHGFKR